MKWEIERSLAIHQSNLAETVDVPPFALQPGDRCPGTHPNRPEDIFSTHLTRFADYAESAGVEVDIEEPGLLVECTDEVLELIDDVGSDALGVNLDIGHAAAYGEDPTEGVRKYAGNITGVHLKDIAGGRRGNIITESLAKAISIQERF